MTDTGDLDGNLTRLDIEGLDTWFKRLGHIATGIERQLGHLSAEAPDMVGTDWRLYQAKLLRNRHEAVLTEARAAVGRIAVALRNLESTGRAVTGDHAVAEDDNARGLRHADDNV